MEESTPSGDARPQQVGHLCVDDVAEGGRRGLPSFPWGEDCTLVYFQVKRVKNPLDLAGSVCCGVPSRPHNSDWVVFFGTRGAVGEGGAHVGLDG
jgi:hypothetical protein